MKKNLKVSFTKSINSTMAPLFGVSDINNLDNLTKTDLIPLTLNKDNTLNVPSNVNKLYLSFNLIVHNDWKKPHSINGDIDYYKTVCKFTKMYQEKFGLTELAAKYNKTFLGLITHLCMFPIQPTFTEIKVSNNENVSLNMDGKIKAIEDGLNGGASLKIELLVKANDIKALLDKSELTTSSNYPERLFFSDLTIKSVICKTVINSFYAGKKINEYLKNLNKYCQDLEQDKLDRKEADFIISSFIAGNVFEFETN
ncbi:MAG: hypothetical protein K2Q03_02320 [Sphingobacteriaceae bacterium]|nr:hypothetical protein [Sphingobacteriaceae bacterium]